MGGVADFVEDTFDAVGDVVEDIGDAVVDVVDFVVDDIIDPIVGAVGDVIDAIEEDPLMAIAQVALVATGNAWALPLLAGADVAMAGGDLGDVLKAAAISYVAGEVGSYVGNYVNSAAQAAQYGVTAGTQQAAMLATQEAGMQLSHQIAGRVIGSAAGASAAAVVMGRDPMQAFITGGVTAAVPAVLGQVPGFTKLPPSAQQVISQAVTAQLSGGNVTTAVIGSVIRASGIVTDILNDFDPPTDAQGKPIPPEQRKMTDAQRAIATDVLIGSATAALSGGNVSAAMQSALMKSGTKALGDMVKSGFKDAVSDVSKKNAAAEKTAAQMDANIEQQKKVAGEYNKTVEELNGRVAEQDRLKAEYDKAVAEQKKNPNQATTDAANAAAKRYNDYATKLNDDYAKTYQPQIDTYAKELAKIQTDYGNLETVFNDALKGVVDATSAVKKELTPVVEASNKAFVEVMDPNFKADEYRRINGLGADVDVYEHWLSQGQYEGLKTNDKDVVVRDSIDKYVAATGEEPPKHILESFTRGDNDNRDKDMQQYVDTTIRDREKQAEFRSQVTNSVLDAYKAEGLSDEQINAKIDSGEANQYVDTVIQRKRESVAAMQEYTRAVGEKFGAESSEYKAAYKDTLNTMADVGGYGVTKDEDKFNLAGAGTLDPDTLKPDTGGSRGWYDPVTGTYRVEMWLKNAKDYSALLGIGESANPPSQGGKSVFGDGSGVSSGLFGGLMPIAFDDGRGDQGAKMFGGDNGFALITYSDGTGSAINTNTNEVLWVSPEDVQKLLGEVPQPKPPVPSKGNATAPTPEKPVVTDPVTGTTQQIKDKIQSPQEVVAALKAAGYTATLEEAKQFAGEKTPEQLRAEAAAYADPRVVNEDEVKAAYEALGLKRPTQEDVKKLMGQYAETDLAGKAKENLDSARYNSLVKQIEDLATQSGVDPAVLETIKNDLNKQVTALGGDLTKLSSDVANTKDVLKQAIADAQEGNTESFDAVNKAIADLKAAGLTTEQVQKIVEDSSAGVSKEFKTALDAAAKGNIEALDKAKTALEGKIGGVQTQLSGVENALTQAIADAKAAGLQGDAALQAAINTVAGNLGTTKADLLAQLGTTEANLKSEFATQLAGVSQDVQAKYDALTADQKALANQLAQQGVDLSTAIDTAKTQLTGQITDLSTDVQAKYDALTAEQKALADQLAQQGVDLSAAIDTAKTQFTDQLAGVSQDVQTKYDALSQGQKDLAKQLTDQGFDLNTAIGLVRDETQQGFKDVFGTIDANQAATQQAIDAAQAAAAADAERTRRAQAAEAERTRQANAAAALKTQRMGNINSMMGMLGQAPDAGGQQVTVKAPDPTKIGYIYDFNSIFANPAQEKMFVSPYAQGGVVRNDIDDVNDELLKLLKG